MTKLAPRTVLLRVAALIELLGGVLLVALVLKLVIRAGPRLAVHVLDLDPHRTGG